MILTPQDEFLAQHKYADVIANTALFPDPPTYAEYIRRRRELRELGVPVQEMRGRPKLTVQGGGVRDHPGEVEDLWKALVAMQQENAPLPTTARIEIATEYPVGIVFTSDWHIGSVWTDHEALRRDVERIAAFPGLFAYVGGDPTDNMVISKLGHVARDEQVLSPRDQWRVFRWLIERLRPSLIAVGRGNHDAWTHREAGIDGIEAALHGVPVLHTGEDTYLELVIGTQEYVIYRKHRPVSSSRIHRSQGVKRAYEWGQRIFDVGVTEHFHEASVSCEIRHGRYRWFVTTGSYKILDPYAREHGFSGGGPVMPVAVFWPDRHKITVDLSLDDAIDRLRRWYQE